MTPWRRWFRSRALERELDAELRDHIEREVAEGVRAGNAEADVRRQIRLTSGGLDQVKEVCRDVRRPPALADSGQTCDLRGESSPRIGGSRPAPSSPSRSRWAWRTRPSSARTPTCGATCRSSARAHRDHEDGRWARPGGRPVVRRLRRLRRDAQVFDGTAAAFAIGTISLGRDGAAPEQFEGLYVSADTFSVLRVKPMLGRDFSAADDRPGAEAVAIISSNIWKSRYAASRDVLGRKVTVNAATPATIIGVMPDGIRFIDFTDVWLPLAQMPGLAAQRRDTRPLMMIGRLPDGADLDRVRADLSPIAANLAVAHPDTNKDIRPLVNTLLEAYNGGLTLTNSVTLHAAPGRRIHPADRVCQSGESAAGTRGVSIARDRDPRGDRRDTVADRAAAVGREPAAGVVAWVLAVGGSWLALTTLDHHSSHAVALLAPQDGRPPAGNAGGSRAAHHGAFRPGAGTLCLASRDRRWTERRRTHERIPEGAALDPRAARRTVRHDAGAPERRRI